MSMVTTLVALSQFFRNLSTRIRNKAINAIKDRIAVVEDQQVAVEEKRSENMIAAHNSYYAAKAKLDEEYQAKLDEEYQAKLAKMEAELAATKRTIAMVAQGASNELKRELVMLSMELDNLTK